MDAFQTQTQIHGCQSVSVKLWYKARDFLNSFPMRATLVCYIALWCVSRLSLWLTLMLIPVVMQIQLTVHFTERELRILSADKDGGATRLVNLLSIQIFWCFWVLLTSAPRGDLEFRLVWNTCRAPVWIIVGILHSQCECEKPDLIKCQKGQSKTSMLHHSQVFDLLVFSLVDNDV